VRPRAAQAIAIVLLLLVWPGSGPAWANPACTVTADLAFGQLDTTSGTTMTAAGSARVECTGGAPDTAYTVCIGPIGRPLQISGPGPFAFEAYTDMASTDRFAQSTPTTLQVSTTTAGQGSATLPLYAQVVTARGEILAGSYTASIPIGSATCPGGISATGTLRASAEVVKRCTLDIARHVDFGVIEPDAKEAVAQGVLTVTCTRDAVPYRIGLGNGLAFANGTRAMRGQGGVLPYGLFRDPRHSQPWGSEAASDVAATGTAAAQRFTVFGKVVMPSPRPAPGQYRDEVVVTVTY
jgi:spore coat protein U-like protein